MHCKIEINIWGGQGDLVGAIALGGEDLKVFGEFL